MSNRFIVNQLEHNNFTITLIFPKRGRPPKRADPLTVSFRVELSYRKMYLRMKRTARIHIIGLISLYLPERA